ncbi:pyruvate kinase [Austwickia sp. TVS 96-490-7B]|uniref:pyruvate kinase n=1 Tax=Austwickia sp. TVS 96-490-7B TaxID=2830843 RepID=UPI001C56DA88|nr:pyruvate kinase [Austwickia sp. TVS 96-490-7B]
MRRAKIVCTIGPAVDSPDKIRALVDAGMDVARINRSHGSYEDAERHIAMVRQAADDAGRNVAILVDLQGPKIRTGRFATGPVLLNDGDRFTITIDDVEGDAERVSTTFKGLTGDVRPGDLLLVDDGKITLRATEVSATDVVTEVVEGGTISNNKGINLPGVPVSVPALSDKDEEDLRWALRNRADWIALSFVRDARDVIRCHEIMEDEQVRRPVLAKIEKPQAVANLAEIIRAFDGIMVARGDLGVEMPLEEVPLVQKQAVALARREAKPVIVATQVLESMIDNSRPTRAEASDCANAVLDGADALMLSGETSVGSWPINAVRTMARIIENTEDHGLSRIPPLGTEPSTVGGAVTAAAARIGHQLQAKYLVCFTSSGDSARRMSRVRSALPMLAFTTDGETARRLSLTWGIRAFVIPQFSHMSTMVEAVDHALLSEGVVTQGDVLVVVAGRPFGVSGTTNSLRVHVVGSVDS